MNPTIVEKVKMYLGEQALYKDSSTTNNLFAGRNLPSFVKDFLLKTFAFDERIDRERLTEYLNKVMPTGDIRSRLIDGEEVTLLTRFSVNIDLVHNVRRFGIPDLGIKESEGQIPTYVASKHPELVNGEMWGLLKLCLLENEDGKKSHVEMVDFKPFKPYISVDISFIQKIRENFTTQEWLDLVISSMEYEPDSFESTHQKLEFVTRLLIFVEPRLNVIELAPKGTGKSYVFNNISKYGWMVSGGKVTRAKLFYDRAKDQPGILKNHDFCAFDEIQTIVFQEPAELQGALKSYLEQGKATIGDKEFSSECGLMLMGNIPITKNREPKSDRYFDSLPQSFKESALLDRFHCFIEGWYLPRISKNMIYKGWTMNMEYFSEIMHVLRVQTYYSELYDKLVEVEGQAGMRESTSVKRIATAYMKLLFPHWRKLSDVNLEEFNTYCLQPAIHRRGIIQEQCYLIDEEYKPQMPQFVVRGLKSVN